MLAAPFLNYDRLYELLLATPARPWLETLPQQTWAALQLERHGRLANWDATVANLPDIRPSAMDLRTGVRVGRAADADPASMQALARGLHELHPWRKGPFDLFGIHIDAEWRSDWKWNRLAGTISPLAGRRVLDVGCGNGYYAWRMLGAGAAFVVGVDPSPLFAMQHAAVRRYLTEQDAFVLPLGVEAIAPELHAFDTVFSMGVLYHRRSPLEHLRELHGALRSGGELVLETLIVDEQFGDLLVPEKRYAQMRNVWAIPSCKLLLTWLRQSNFVDARIINITPTTTEEQRQTEWMTFHSLADFLDPRDARKTVEGYPAPIRAIAIARLP
ncbi:putative methyltransferase [Rubidibacter lacunae KORDI 51-2]|uniref:Putative methyltransferase n=1 Tax=Rubidibacter lacunae KORDI 51-2 TaxID=582515 RepID=U5DLW8_9CHRO|nr:tRNA 5-methoxyuridine(34)/uridine 5-oxyacetic acid(34) synthase CmoB [Rubidibacter lacunae]ERN41569.1 putative methyltransferase [Rubidibacter lacunae KORDI 51-2]